MKQAIIISFLLFLSIISFGQNLKEENFKITVKDVITELSKRDSNGLAKYIDAQAGYYLLYRNGTMDTYTNAETLDFSDTTFPNFPFYDKVKYTKLRYEKLPEFDCGSRTWSDTGTFVDTTKADHLLSETAKGLVKNFDEEIPEKTISGFATLEQKSRRVIVAGNNESEVIFYLTYLNKKWCLTIIDKITTDCSA